MITNKSRILFFTSGIVLGAGCSALVIHLKKPRDIEHEAIFYGSPGPIIDILSHNSYIGAYNRSLRLPYWVAEHITKDKLNGHLVRKHIKFKENQSIPHRFRSHLSDYVKSGFDRGHLVPAANVVTSESDLTETFLLSNCTPQNIAFNRGYWANFEKRVRSWTNIYSDVYVMTGPLFLPQKQNDGYYVRYQVIGDPPNTAVPTHFFKVVLATEKDHSYIGGWVFPNADIPSKVPLDQFETPIEAIELSSGLEFFPKVDKSKLKKLNINA